MNDQRKHKNHAQSTSAPIGKRRRWETRTMRSIGFSAFLGVLMVSGAANARQIMFIAGSGEVSEGQTGSSQADCLEMAETDPRGADYLLPKSAIIVRVDGSPVSVGAADLVTLRFSPRGDADVHVNWTALRERVGTDGDLTLEVRPSLSMSKKEATIGARQKAFRRISKALPSDARDKIVRSFDVTGKAKLTIEGSSLSVDEKARLLDLIDEGTAAKTWTAVGQPRATQVRTLVNWFQHIGLHVGNASPADNLRLYADVYAGLDTKVSTALLRVAEEVDGAAVPLELLVQDSVLDSVREGALPDLEETERRYGMAYSGSPADPAAQFRETFATLRMWMADGTLPTRERTPGWSSIAAPAQGTTTVPVGRTRDGRSVYAAFQGIGGSERFLTISTRLARHELLRYGNSIVGAVTLERESTVLVDLPISGDATAGAAPDRNQVHLQNLIGLAGGSVAVEHLRAKAGLSIRDSVLATVRSGSHPQILLVAHNDGHAFVFADSSKLPIEELLRAAAESPSKKDIFWVTCNPPAKISAGVAAALVARIIKAAAKQSAPAIFTAAAVGWDRLEAGAVAERKSAGHSRGDKDSSQQQTAVDGMQFVWFSKEGGALSKGRYTIAALVAPCADDDDGSCHEEENEN